MEKSKIEEKALKTLDDAKDTGDAVIDIIGVAKYLGFVVGNVELSDEDDGFIIVEEGKEDILGQKTDKLIGVRADQSVEWKRFIIAHELGHYILHYDKTKNQGMYAHREHTKGKDESENEADFFAANLLMPRDRFIRNNDGLLAGGLSFEERVMLLAKRFLVTEVMTRRRFKELELSEQ